MVFKYILLIKPTISKTKGNLRHTREFSLTNVVIRMLKYSFEGSQSMHAVLGEAIPLARLLDISHLFPSTKQPLCPPCPLK